MTIKILTLSEAASLLNMTEEGLRRKTVSGEIPGAKLGKRWSFIEADLVQYLRSLYTSTPSNKFFPMRIVHYQGFFEMIRPWNEIFRGVSIGTVKRQTQAERY